MTWLSFGLGALTLWALQGLYRLGCEHGAITRGVDEQVRQRLHAVIRHAPRDPRADISRAERRDWWN
jgi:hypothetical protein